MRSSNASSSFIKTNLRMKIHKFLELSGKSCIRFTPSDGFVSAFCTRKRQKRNLPRRIACWQKQAATTCDHRSQGSWERKSNLEAAFVRTAKVFLQFFQVVQVVEETRVKKKRYKLHSWRFVEKTRYFCFNWADSWSSRYGSIRPGAGFRAIMSNMASRLRFIRALLALSCSLQRMKEAFLKQLFKNSERNSLVSGKFFKSEIYQEVSTEIPRISDNSLL